MSIYVHEIYTGQNWGHASTMFHASVDQRVGRVGPPWVPKDPQGSILSNIQPALIGTDYRLYHVLKTMS